MDVGDLLTKVSDDLSVRRAFGAAYEKDGMLIIPVALVAGGGGAGTARPRDGNPAARPGSPPSEDPTTQNAAPPESVRPDAGGGFGGVVLPTGAYVVKGDQVRWVPAVDATIVIVASLGLVGILARALTRRRRYRGRR
jgi:uncharacterized spore protein YtfJ